MDIEGNMMVEWLIGFNIIAEQLFNIPLEMFYAELGADGVFKLWWIYHLVMFLQCYILAPVLIIWNAHRKFPEFSGLEGKTFPGQEKPRTLPIVPRRGETDQGLSKTIIPVKNTSQQRPQSSNKWTTIQMHAPPQNRQPQTNSSIHIIEIVWFPSTFWVNIYRKRDNLKIDDIPCF